jgi:magnesium transporter
MINDQPVKITVDHPSELIMQLKGASIAWVNFTVDNVEKEAPLIASILGFSTGLCDTLMASSHSAYEDRESELGLRVPAVRSRGLDVFVYPLLILIRKKLIVTIHGTEVVRLVQFARYADTFMRKIKADATGVDKLTILLMRILDENNSRNFDHLREIDEQADELSKHLMDPTTPRFKLGPEIYKMKHALIVHLNSMWATREIVQCLRYGDAELITDNAKLLGQISMLVEDINNHISLSEHMSEVLASGLEVLQSIYNNQLQILNNRMAMVMTWLTILGTAVLVPNTIATIMGNSAFNLQGKDIWWYTAFLAVSTVVATYIAYWWVKRVVKLPKKIS